VGLKDRLKPVDLVLVWLLLRVEETGVMIGEGFPVAVRLTDVVDEFTGEDNVLSGPTDVDSRLKEPYGVTVTLAEPEEALPADIPDVVNSYPLKEVLSALALLVNANDEDIGHTVTDRPVGALEASVEDVLVVQVVLDVADES
jgi:hypothetical protein